MEHFVIIVKDGMRVTIITKSFILDVAAVLHPALKNKKWKITEKRTIFDKYYKVIEKSIYNKPEYLKVTVDKYL